MNVNERAAQMLHQYADYLRDERPPSGHEDADVAEMREAEARALADGLTHGIHLITAAPVLPDDDGFWAHPAIPDHFDEDPAPFERWLNEQLLECAPEEVGDENAEVAADWADSKPSGSGWFLLQLIDTEDGPTAFWVRRVMENPNAHKVSVLRGELVRERDYRLRAEAQVDFLKHRLGDEHASVWYWQGDGYDNLDSLVSSVTVAIRADDLRHLLGAPQVAVPEGFVAKLEDLVLDAFYDDTMTSDKCKEGIQELTAMLAAAPTAPAGEPECCCGETEQAWRLCPEHGPGTKHDRQRLAAQQPVSDPDGVPDITSTVVNDACWTFIEAMPHQLPAPIFNNLKPALYEALKHYHRAALPAPDEREIAARAVHDAAQYAQDQIENRGAVTPESTAALDAVQAFANTLEGKS